MIYDFKPGDVAKEKLSALRVVILRSAKDGLVLVQMGNVTLDMYAANLEPVETEDVTDRLAKLEARVAELERKASEPPQRSRFRIW